MLDAEGNDVPAGQPGLVYMRMGTSTFDYHKDEEKTRASRARGMFTVGDIGYLDADGYLFLCDRKSDMIISGGVNIYPAEIEAELSGHPAVADVAVFGIPHEDWGEEIKAVVQPAPGAEPGPALTAELLGVPGRPGGEVQAAADHRLRRRTAPRPQRQALQAAAPRPLLGRPRPRHLNRPATCRWPAGYKLVHLRVEGRRAMVSTNPQVQQRVDDRRTRRPGGDSRRAARCSTRWPPTSAGAFAFDWQDFGWRLGSLPRAPAG